MLRVLIAHDTQGRGAEVQIAASGWVQSTPTGGENAEEMSTGEEQHIAVESADAGDDAVGPGTDFRQALAARAAIAEELPIGPFLADVHRLAPFIGAVVPLDQLGI